MKIEEATDANWVIKDSIAEGVSMNTSLVTREQPAEDADAAAQEKEASGKQQQGSVDDGRTDSAHLGEDRSCDSAEICNQSGQTNHLIILNIYIQSASANASEYQRYGKVDQVPKE